MHAGRDDLTALGVHVPPIDLSTTYPLTDLQAAARRTTAWRPASDPAGGSLVYQRLWNPNVARLENRLGRAGDLRRRSGLQHRHGRADRGPARHSRRRQAARRRRPAPVRRLGPPVVHRPARYDGQLGDPRHRRRSAPPRHRAGAHRDPGQPDGRARRHRRRGPPGVRRTGGCGQHVRDARTPAARAARRHARAALGDQVPGRPRRPDGRPGRRTSGVGRQDPADACGDRGAALPAGGVRAAPGTADAAGPRPRSAGRRGEGG